MVAQMTQIQTQDYTSVREAAIREAQRLEHTFLTPEHMLVGLLLTPCDGGKFLERNGFTVDKVRTALEKRIGVRPGAAREDAFKYAEPPMTLRSLSITKAAEELARGYSKPVNTLHLLWAVLEERNCEATRLLTQDNGDPSGWISEIQDLLTEATTRRHQVLSFRSDDSGPSRSNHWSQKLAEACSSIGNKIVGQSSAVQRVADTLTRSWAGLLGSGRPTASFLFVGPRGSGKQTLARNVAKFLYDDPERIIKLSLDEYSDEAQAGRLLGTNTGTLAEQEGTLSKLVRESPYSVVYLEDVERAHPKAMEGLHQLLERGHVFDGRGQRVEFRDNVIVLSVVVDPEFLEGEAPLGLRKNRQESKDRQEQYERNLMPDLERVLRADTLGLVDEVVFFPPLGTSELTELLNTWSKELVHEMMQRHSIRLTINSEVFEHLIKVNEEICQGAGSLHRLFVRRVCTDCAKALLEKRICQGDNVEIRLSEGELVFERQERKRSRSRSARNSEPGA